MAPGLMVATPVAVLPAPVVVTAAGPPLPAMVNANWSIATKRPLGSAFCRRKIGSRLLVKVHTKLTLAPISALVMV